MVAFLLPFFFFVYISRYCPIISLYYTIISRYYTKPIKLVGNISNSPSVLSLQNKKASLNLYMSILKDILSKWKTEKAPEKTEKVISTAIDSYDYYPDQEKLVIRYRSNPNKGYTFERVTKNRKKELDRASSKGRFVHYVLRRYNRAKGY